MATISLYASKINNMPSLINDVKKAVTDYKSELVNLKNKALKVNTSVCDLSDVVSEISSSTKTQDEKIASLEALQKNSEQFVSDTVKIDNEVADLINKRKDEFYNEYTYLRPECEKNGWEKFCDGVKSVGEWCKQHWKIIATAVLVAASIVVICTGVGGLLGAMALGCLLGSIVGGTVGGVTSALRGESILDGFENGAFSGAISGIITGGLTYGMTGTLTGTLSLGKTMIVGGVSDAGSSIAEDVGNILIKGDNISFAELACGSITSFVTGSVFSAAPFGISKLGSKIGLKVEPIKIKGINKGNGSWMHVWKTQSTKVVRYGNKISAKTIAKGAGAKIVDERWDYIIDFLWDISIGDSIDSFYASSDARNSKPRKEFIQ